MDTTRRLSRTPAWVTHALLMICLLPVTGVLADDGLTVAHLARLRRVTHAVISPAGTHVAYLLSVPRQPFTDDNGSSWRELHVVDSKGASKPFVTGRVNVGSINWTPDGKGISFLAKRDGDKHTCLYVIPFDGGEARRVLAHDTSISEYTWSPDGQNVAFAAPEKPDKKRKKERDKGFDAHVYEEDSKPVRLWMGRPGAYSMSGDSAPAEPSMIALQGSVSALHWSPTGEHLVLCVAPSSRIDDHYMRRKIAVLDVERRQIVANLDNPGKLGDLAISPDGRRVVVTAAADLHDPSPGRLMVGSIQGGALRDLLPGYLGDAVSIAWEDNATIKYTADEGVWSTFREVHSDGSAPRTLVPVGKLVLSQMTLSSDGRSAAFLSHSPEYLPEVFFMQRGEPRPRRLTDSNPWLGEIRLAPQEIVRYTSRDGVALEGLLIRPLDEQPGTRYPLILIVHGGPESHYGNGWLTRYHSPGQIAARRGFMVLYPNYRGGTGRGVAFAKSSQNDYGGKEFDDLIDGVDELISRGLVDPQRVGITGGSYGGFAAAWCATVHSERFAAAVMFLGVSDQVSKYGTTDIPQEMVEVHSLRYPWEAWDTFRERSPVYHFQKCRTPMLIMHGENDKRVHTSQSLIMYRYLKSGTRVPVRLVLYPGEGHGNRKAAARLDYCMRLLRWMEHYLKGAGGEPPAYELDYDLLKPPPTDGDEDA